MPVFDMIEAFFIMKMNFKPSKFLRFLIRNGYVGKHFSFPFFFLDCAKFSFSFGVSSSG